MEMRTLGYATTWLSALIICSATVHHFWENWYLTGIVIFAFFIVPLGCLYAGIAIRKRKQKRDSEQKKKDDKKKEQEQKKEWERIVDMTESRYAKHKRKWHQFWK